MGLCAGVKVMWACVCGGESYVGLCVGVKVMWSCVWG